MGAEQTSDGSGPNDATRGLDRRGFLRRAAVVGAPTAWAVPTVQSLVTPAFAVGTAPGGCSSCLSGGGRIATTPARPVLAAGATIDFLTFSVGQLCCEGKGPVDITVSTRSGKGAKDVTWHFTDNLVVTCSAVGSVTPSPRHKKQPVCANRFTGTASDKAGNSLAFVFEDDEQPGQLLGTVSLTVTGPSGSTLLSANGVRGQGNLRTHPSMAPITRDCSGC